MTDGDNLFQYEADVLERTVNTAAIERRELHDINADLKAVYRSIKSDDISAEVLERISELLHNAKDREMVVAQKVDYLYTVHKKLSVLDLGLFPDLKKQLEKASGEQRLILSKYLTEEHNNIYQKLEKTL